MLNLYNAALGGRMRGRSGVEGSEGGSVGGSVGCRLGFQESLLVLHFRS